MQNIKSHTKYKIKRFIGRYLPQYRQYKNRLNYLTDTLPVFMNQKFSNVKADKKFLIVSSIIYDAMETVYAKALENLGYETHILTPFAPYISEMYKTAGITNIHYSDEFFMNNSSKRLINEAEQYLEQCNGKEILNLTKNGIHFGKFASSDYMRATRESTINLENDNQRHLFLQKLIFSLSSAIAMDNAIEKIKPDLVFMIDRGYSPVGQLFDSCMNNSIPVITRNASHKSGFDLLKRYSSEKMSSVHPASLSDSSWNLIKKIEWTDNQWIFLYEELKKNYLSGDWYSEVGTQFNKKMYIASELKSLLNLDPNKKTAIIFPHMFWDATFFWGKDLFNNYYDWFVNVLKTAAINKNINWIIKIHPANMVKAKRDNYKGANREHVAVFDALGETLPEHIKIIPSESDINTFCLFDIMDFCLTVRGTIGIETAAMGINTITAGTGRFDRLGFTHDFDTQEDYFQFLENLHQVGPMSAKQIELARRFAYGIFILRPLKIDILEAGFRQDEKASLIFKPLFKSIDDFNNSSFTNNFNQFIASGEDDFFNPINNNLNL
jgi:hypothetical protein